MPAPAEFDVSMLLDSVSDYAIFALDRNGFIQTWNQGARLLKGYSADEIIGQHFSRFYPKAMIERDWPATELRIAEAEGRFEDRGWRLRKDGSQFWANVVISKLVDRHGEFIGFSKVTRDLTDQRSQEDLLRLSEERFRLLVAGISDYALIMLDPDGYIVSWNVGAKRAIGYSSAEVIGKHFETFYPHEVRLTDWPNEELRYALKDGRFEDQGWRLRKDGTRFWANSILTPLFDPAGKHIGFAKITKDMSTERRIATLETEGKRINTFLAMLGHELRNPLAPIANSIAVMSRMKDLPPMAESSIKVVDRQLKRMTRLVDDLLDVGRITNGKIRIELQAMPMDSAVLEAAESARLLAEKKQIELIVAVDPEPLVVLGDHARLVQLVENLLTNAVKFTAAHGRIWLTLRSNRKHAEVVVRDTGSGIAADLQAKVFDLFVQGATDDARSTGGLGLGLSLVRQLARLHNGDVVVFSAGVAGEGSEFTLRIPLSERKAAVPQPALEERQEMISRRILVVDDQRDQASTLAELLQSHGHQVFVAYDGIDALAQIVEVRPEIALLDIGLPGLSGIEVAERVQRLADRPALIAVSGYGSDKDRDVSLAFGFHAHLTKPVDIAELLNTISALSSARD